MYIYIYIYTYIYTYIYIYKASRILEQTNPVIYIETDLELKTMNTSLPHIRQTYHTRGPSLPHIPQTYHVRGPTYFLL